jgi:transposase InsO family protein
MDVNWAAVLRASRRGRHLGFGWQRWGFVRYALAETINGLYKTELIKPRGPWRTVEQVEYATAEWVDWFNHRRLYEYCGDIPPAELEAAHYREHQPRRPVGSSETK